MKSSVVVCFSAALGLFATQSALAGPTWAFWDFNNTTGSTANDLTLTFTTNVTNNLKQVQNTPMTDAAVNGKSVTFTAVDKSQNVPSQGNCPKAFPQCSRDHGMTLLDPGPTTLTSAVWSLLSGGNAPAVPLPNIKVFVGRKSNNTASITITNDDTQLVYFQSTDAATAIDPGVLDSLIPDNELDFELDANPADNPNAVAEPDFSLAPGETETFDLGTDPLGDYTSVVFTESFDPNFQVGDTFTVGYSQDAPEPPALLLFVAGAGLLARLRTYKSRAA